jgi:hypothetical protein
VVPEDRMDSIMFGKLDLVSWTTLNLERSKPDGRTGPKMGHSSVGRPRPLVTMPKQSSDK